MLKGLKKKKNDKKEQGKTQHQTPRSKNHKAIQKTKEQGKTQHETPRSKNHKVTQTKNKLELQNE